MTVRRVAAARPAPPPPASRRRRSSWPSAETLHGSLRSSPALRKAPPPTRARRNRWTRAAARVGELVEALGAGRLVFLPEVSGGPQQQEEPGDRAEHADVLDEVAGAPERDGSGEEENTDTHAEEPERRADLCGDQTRVPFPDCNSASDVRPGRARAGWK